MNLNLHRRPVTASVCVLGDCMNELAMADRFLYWLSMQCSTNVTYLYKSTKQPFSFHMTKKQVLNEYQQTKNCKAVKGQVLIVV